MQPVIGKTHHWLKLGNWLHMAGQQIRFCQFGEILEWLLVHFYKHVYMWCMFTKAHKEVWISGVGNGRWGFCFMTGSSKWLYSGSHWREQKSCREIVGVLGVFILCEPLLLKLGLGGAGKAVLAFRGENMKWGRRARGCRGAHLPSQCASWCSESYHCL